MFGWDLLKAAGAPWGMLLSWQKLWHDHRAVSVLPHVALWQNSCFWTLELCYQAWWREKCVQKLTSIWASVGIFLDIPHLEEMGIQHPQLSAKKWKKIWRSLSCCCPVITFMRYVMRIYVLFSFLSIMRLNGLFYVEKWALCIPAQSHAGAETPNGDFAGYI